MVPPAGSEQLWGLAGLPQGAMSARTVCGLTSGISIYRPCRGKPTCKPCMVPRTGELKAEDRVANPSPFPLPYKLPLRFTEY